MFARSNKTFINFNNVLELKGFEFYNSQLPTGKKENLNRSWIYFYQKRIKLPWPKDHCCQIVVGRNGETYFKTLARWLGPANLKQIARNTFPDGRTPCSYGQHRIEQVVLARCRIGRSRLTHSYLLNNEERSECIPCNSKGFWVLQLSITNRQKENLNRSWIYFYQKRTSKQEALHNISLVHVAECIILMLILSLLLWSIF
jgi:hypothetical protein